MESALRQIEAPASQRLTNCNFWRVFSLGKLKIRSHVLYRWQLERWWRGKERHFDLGFAIHLKAAAWFRQKRIPYVWEAHEIFSETAPGLVESERLAVRGARIRIATSHALAEGLRKRFGGDLVFTVVPNAGQPPEHEEYWHPEGPILYAGGLEVWKGLDVALAAALALGKRVRLVGGTEKEKAQLLTRLPYPERHGWIEWQPYQGARELLRYFKGVSVGIIPTRLDTPSGYYSCPMKLFDYARCGIPVVASALPALESLEIEGWLFRVFDNKVEGWRAALGREHRGGAEIKAWAARHTWQRRGERLAEVLRGGRDSSAGE